ncbi:TIGR02611 family protein [Kineococcus sp. SYSU DK001]|uniref:TIGR02611 family protein n=1 Tax=Kineococcus sp. SYSU DK001 TaxID=3383122 RepID=UPI003D7D80CE
MHDTHDARGAGDAVERSGEDPVAPGGGALPDPPAAPARVRGEVGGEAPGGAAGETAGEAAALTPHQHRVRRARAALHARRERIRADAHRNRVYRAVVGALGSLVVVVGLALVPLPGPGWLVVFMGLAVLGTEFSSAQRLKRFGERQVHRWTRWIARRSLATRAALGTGAAAGGAALVWGYLAWQGLPSWTPEVVTAQLRWVPGL